MDDACEDSPPAGFFGPDSPYLNHPLLTDERTVRELDEIERLVGPVRGRAVLDIGCGFGRHSVEAARRGALVTAVDPSSTMIAAAETRARQLDLSIETVVGHLDDLSHLGDLGHLDDLGDLGDLQAADGPEAGGRFDVGLCLFTTFGQRDPNDPTGSEPERALLQAAARLLQPGAALVVELPDRARHVQALVTAEQLGSTAVTRSFDTAASLIEERFDVADGSSYLLAIRLYSPQELTELLAAHGFEVEAVISGPLVSPPASLMTVIARLRPGQAGD